MSLQLQDTQLRRRATLIDYLAMARPGHWVKHLFIVPGVVLAYLLRPQPFSQVAVAIGLGFISAAAIASANYVLNEWLDARSDAFHRSKAARPAVAKEMSAAWVLLEYLVLALLGLALALGVSKLFFLISCLFLVSGWIYNVPPIRSKDLPFVDVITESLNNPIRLTLGWVMVDSLTLPPSSLLLAYWMGGAFLMALKRMAEFRSARDHGQLDQLALYRRSFRSYSETSLLLASFLYSLLAAFFLAVFLIKYRVEYLLSLPLFAMLFVSYLAIALKKESRVQAPEGLFREKSLIVLGTLLVVALALLSWIDLPILERLSDPHYIEVAID